MNCPICSKPLIRDSKDCYFCEHGLLISGGFLSKAKSSYTKLDLKNKSSSIKPSSSRHKIIKCPNCSMQMTKIDFVGSGIEIESCSNCKFRWLDNGELEQIRSIKPHLTREDLIFISNLESKLTKERRFANSRLPYFSLARYLSAGLYGFGDKKTAGISTIASLGIMGAIKLLLTPLGRLFLLVIAVIFGLSAWSIISFMTN